MKSVGAQSTQSTNSSHSPHINPDGDAKLCSVEAEAAIKEVAFGVKEIQKAGEALPCTDTVAYLNLTTLEGEPMCVEISIRGFCPVGQRYDEIKTESDGENQLEFYETIYALLSTRSRRFRDQFSQRLCDKLQKLQDQSSDA